ncbi:metallophosphoesterase family protein [Desulforhabdus amnigena]|uniref:Serine/threonine protein phosphatase n=1 Tax=Desulforhabdus amnigena TaxID=40218 RepID=A0A9W6FVK9_9BACT|nr:metallophosphoesterase family protein [Desulforhabdus amnigena]NLJ28205.1 metallophosphoesterase family protein [Deltaproteobacteria bacterium]GLI35710.1 serine/threonine protein phosphatase [Desulforhabdus amnigena]
MRIAVISDIHGNLEAFREVLKNLDQTRVDCVASLGDNIGYGPEPEEVLELLKARNIPSVMGNHELGIVDPSFLPRFNPSARLSLEITRRLLSPASIEYLKTFKASRVVCDCLCVHGFPPDSINTYLFQVSESLMHRAFLELQQEICFVGHTHELALVVSKGLKHHAIPLEEGIIFLPKGEKYIINVGSVGQPRDGDNRAKYVIWDGEARTLDVRFIPYDIAATVKKILDLGFPEINARRLW